MSLSPILEKAAAELREKLPRRSRQMFDDLLAATYQEGRNQALQRNVDQLPVSTGYCQHPFCRALVFNNHHCEQGHLQERTP